MGGLDWLTQLKPGTMDTDMTDEAAWKARPELEAKWKARQASEKKVLKGKVKSDRAGIKAAQAVDWEGTKNELDYGQHKTAGDRFDTDMADEEAWKARSTLKNASKTRKAKEAAELAAANRAYRARVKNTTRSDEIDDNLMDEDAWAVRPQYIAADKEFKAREALNLEIKNAEARERLRRIKPMVEITSAHGKAEYVENPKKEYLEPFLFSSPGSPPRSRDKTSPSSAFGWSQEKHVGEGVGPPPIPLDKYTPEWFAASPMYKNSINKGGGVGSLSGTFMSGTVNAGGSFCGSPVRAREKSSSYQKLIGYNEKVMGMTLSNPTDVVEPDTTYVPRLSARFTHDPHDTRRPPSWLPQALTYDWDGI
jgi:hypothetical protein